MLHSILNAIKLRVLIVFLVIHLGLIFSVYGLAIASREADLGSSYWFMLGGIAGLYGGILLTVFFVFLPIYSLTQKIRRILTWKDWIMQELPQLLALIPTLVETIRSIFQGFQSEAESSTRGPSNPPNPSSDPSSGPSAHASSTPQVKS